MEFSIFETSPIITLTLNEKQLHSPAERKGEREGEKGREARNVLSVSIGGVVQCTGCCCYFHSPGFSTALCCRNVKRTE